MADKPIRLNLRVNPKVRDRLESLKDRSQAESLTEVIRRSLALYEMLLNAEEEGVDIILRSNELEISDELKGELRGKEQKVILIT